MPTSDIPGLAGPSEQIKLRSDHFRSLADIDDTPASLHVFAMDPETDEPVEETPGSSKEVLAKAELFHIQSVQLPQEERAQVLPDSADDGKIIFFGRTTRMYGISGFLVDSKASGGHLMAWWDDLYERFFRLTACLKDRHIVRLRWRLSSMYGYLLSNIKSLESTMPSVCSVNFTFLSLFETEALEREPKMTMSYDMEVAGKASLDTLRSLGLEYPEAVTLVGSPVGDYLNGRPL